jgi:hypothetical protein
MIDVAFGLIQLALGAGILYARTTRRALAASHVRLAAVIVGCGLVYWVAGQGMGQPWSGLATDPGTAPLVVLLGVAVLGAAPGAGRPGNLTRSRSWTRWRPLTTGGCLARGSGRR